jgi:hypothetical protein
MTFLYLINKNYKVKISNFIVSLDSQKTLNFQGLDLNGCKNKFEKELKIEKDFLKGRYTLILKFSRLIF